MPESKSCSFGREILPTRSVNNLLSSATSCDTMLLTSSPLPMPAEEMVAIAASLC